MSEPDTAHPKRRVRGLALALLMLLAAGSFVTWSSLRSTPEQLLQQGLTALPRDAVRAEHLIRRALDAKRGKYPDAEISLCRLLARRGAWVEAVTLLDTVKLPFCRPDLLLAFGQAALEEGHRAAAHRTLDALSKLSVPESITALELLVNDYEEWGQIEQSLTAARELTRCEPQNPARWSSLIQLLVHAGRDSECVEVIRAALQTELPPKHRLEAQNALVLRLINLGDIPGLRSELTKLKQAEGDSIRVQGHHVYLYRLEGKQDQALATISKLIATLSQQGAVPQFAYFTRGVIYLDLRRYTEAAQDFQRTIAAEPLNAPAHFKLSEVYRGLGQDEQAVKHRNIAAGIVEKQKRISALLKQRQTNPRDANLYLELAGLNRDLGNFEAAHKWQQWSVRVQQSESE